MKYLWKYLWLILLFIPTVCQAEEFIVDKKYNAGELLKEIQTATGWDLEGENQIGYMNTAGNKITFVLKDRKFTDAEVKQIQTIIDNHDVVAIEQAEKQAILDKQKAASDLLATKGWTMEEAKILVEGLK